MQAVVQNQLFNMSLFKRIFDKHGMDDKKSPEDQIRWQRSREKEILSIQVLQDEPLWETGGP